MKDVLNNDQSKPLAYLITCRTYATWLHGDSRGSVDRIKNKFLTPKIKRDAKLQRYMKKRLKESPFLMNKPQSNIVSQSIFKTCEFAEWKLYASHVRSNHFHVVLDANNRLPGQVAVSLKAYATRYLKCKYPELNRRRYWSKGFSARHIFDSVALLRAIQYTVEDQHGVMACYCCPEYAEVLKGRW